MPVEFKRPGLEAEFRKLHPAVRSVVVELHAWLEGNSMPGVIITEALRDAATMANYYGADWRGRKWSWHLVGRAVDIRNRHWDPVQRTQIVKYLETNWPDAEVLMHDVVGDHLHFAYPAPGSRLKRLKRWAMRRRQARAARGRDA